MSEPPSSPPNAQTSIEDALAWYKAQYELLEQELSEFQASSRELEAELEKDLDAAEKREQALRRKAEGLSYEVEEWKRKYRESKSEANSAQNSLEKEITQLRDLNRTLQLKLRDIEVANDDIERQARHTSSSLEDLESKYNIAIERAVMMEEEIKIGEQERERLRVEAQRLREELADLKIETEILQDKIRKQESRHLSTISTDISIPGSPSFVGSPHSTASSPVITTPPDTKSLSTADTTSELQDPPSPPMSDASAPFSKLPGTRTPALHRKGRFAPSAENTITPKPRNFTGSTSTSRSSRNANTSSTTRSPGHRTSSSRTSRAPSHKVPPPNSLSHIRSLTAQMQRLEARVQSARSKLPSTGPATDTPSRPSARSGMMSVPSTVTIRTRKRTGGSTTSSVASFAGDESTPLQSRHVPRLSSSGASRLSFGPLPNRNPTYVEPDISRPSSRASHSSYATTPSRYDQSHHTVTGVIPPPRPISRTTLSSSRTSSVGRPRSSLGMKGHGGHSYSHSHGHSHSMNYHAADADEFTDNVYPPPSRRGTFSRMEMEAATGMSAIPVPSSRRQSSGAASVSGRRTSGASRVLADLGETY